MEPDVDTLRRQIPCYLTSDDGKELSEGLRIIVSGGRGNYFLSPYNVFKNEMLQGDEWPGFRLFDFDTGQWISVKDLLGGRICFFVELPLQ